MTFSEALIAQQRFGDETIKVSRPGGPVFWIDGLGKIVMADLSSAYTGDFLDLDDWEVEVDETTSNNSNAALDLLRLAKSALERGDTELAGTYLDTLLEIANGAQP